MPTDAASPDTPAAIEIRSMEGGELRVEVSGDWLLERPRPSPGALHARLAGLAGAGPVRFDAGTLGRWDSSLLTALRAIEAAAGERGLAVDDSGLPEGARRLLRLAASVPPATGTGRGGGRGGWLAALGRVTQGLAREAPEMLRFVGEATLAFGRFLLGRARYRRSDLWLTVQEVGPQALPIVSVLAFLIGLILAYMGAIQLAQFGAQIYVANLVAISMVREMGALITGVIVAGRSGAAFAAQLGTMQANEEIDALRTLGIPPVEFLVLPRMLALILMVPLLTLYADVLGILAGMLVGVTLLDLGAHEYYRQSLDVLGLRHVAAGLIKGSVYGVLVALAGCLRGMQSGRSAAAVGQATTSAVVTSIVLMVCAAAVLTVMFEALGI